MFSVVETFDKSFKTFAYYLISENIDSSYNSRNSYSDKGWTFD